MFTRRCSVLLFVSCLLSAFAQAQPSAADCVAMADPAARPPVTTACTAAPKSCPRPPTRWHRSRRRPRRTPWRQPPPTTTPSSARAGISTASARRCSPARLQAGLPAAGTWTDRVNRDPASPSPQHGVDAPLVLKSVEAKYQISLKTKFAHSLAGTPLSLWGGYTQSSRWQVYNGADSRPFRERPTTSPS